VVSGRTAAPSVAYQGEPGAFSEEAALAFFGAAIVPRPQPSFDAVTDAVAGGSADFGMLPVENSVAGTVTAAYDALAASPLEVVGEIARPIRHCLLAPPGASRDSIRRVLSHPVALAQCMRFFREHPAIEAVAVHDTAGAARRVAEEADPSCAALAAEAAAHCYGLAVLARDLQDRADNQTRFFVVAQPDVAAARPRADAARKTALLLETDNRPGALVAVLLPLAEHGINLTHLASRPGGGPWTYRFFLEMDADAGAAATRAALEVVRSRSASFRVLGSFPALA
jgi:prephenate dehydratase